MTTFRILCAGVLLGALTVAGCHGSECPCCAPGGEAAAGPSASGQTASGQPSGTEYLLPKEPAGAEGVAQLRTTAATGDEAVVLGRIGGDKAPFVEGVAAFLIVDPGLNPCKKGCGCPTPWDYCCDLNELPANKAMVKVVDRQGKIVAEDARKLLGVKELTTVVARGKAKRDEAGNLTVLAEGVYLRP